MPNLFTRMPFAVARTDLPTVDMTQAVPVFQSAYEYDATGHWLFGTDRGLVDLISSQALTQQGSAPTQAANYLSLSGGSGNGLLTPYNDAAVQTMCAVVRLPSAVAAMLAGTITATAGDGGSGLFIIAASPLSASGNSRPLATLNNTKTISPSTWVFVALSENLAAANGDRTLFVGGGTPLIDSASASAKTISNKKIAVGNGYYTTFSGAADFAEYIYFTSRKTAAELAAIYGRSQARLGARGIVVS